LALTVQSVQYIGDIESSLVAKPLALGN